MPNFSMKRKLDKAEAIDVSIYPKNADGDYILDLNASDIEDIDLCDSKTEQWIWSVGQHLETGQVLASVSAKFYQNPAFKCIWLR